MLQTRIIPALLLSNESLVKTIKFKNSKYIGDPVNTVKIFNELEVDELMFLDIGATTQNNTPNYKVLKEIANECFMPLSYGGGVKSFEIAKIIFDIGFEKIVLNSQVYVNQKIVSEISAHYGNQAVVVSIDVKKNIFGKYEVWINSGKINTKLDPLTWAKKVEELGAGEILLTSIDREGSWKGFDIDLVSKISNSVSIPVIAHGGAGNINDINDVIKMGGASAVALGSMLVYQQKNMGVLINFPDKTELTGVLV